jgi:hypothetical protein
MKTRELFNIKDLVVCAITCVILRVRPVFRSLVSGSNGIPAVGK